MTFADFIDPTVRLFAAVIVGGLVGLNRDLHGKPTGVRVHALVALGSAVLILAGNALNEPASNSRIIQGIIQGIGFLGAGVIMHGWRSGSRGQIFHLTTAASIWVTAALGVCCGLAVWHVVVPGALAVLLVLVFGIRIDLAAYAKAGVEREPGAEFGLSRFSRRFRKPQGREEKGEHEEK